MVDLRYAVVCFIIVFRASNCLHLKGTWESENFFKFLTKFGFQKTDMHDSTNTQGYIFGNITSKSQPKYDFSFVVVDSEYFIEFFGNTSFLPREKACENMFYKIDEIAWDASCHRSGSEDFLRKIPCPQNKYCIDEDNPKMVIRSYQFTYRVQDTNQPRFWYVSMVACNRNNKTCHWVHTVQDNLAIDYDIWLVNGDPSKKNFNPFEHQFSFEMHDIVEIYLTFFVLYAFLVPIQMFAFRKQNHSIPKLLSTCIMLEFVGVTCNGIHFVKFAFDGEGVWLLRIVGNLMNTIGPILFMSLVMLIAKGWTITVMELSTTYRRGIGAFWTLFILTQVSLFVWKQFESDLISAEDDWQTMPGYLSLLLSSLVIFWFLFELKNSFAQENNEEKMSFYLHFGAGYLCWFVYMPILALICTQVSALWRYKTILSVSYGADFLAIVCMVHVLWPDKGSSPALFSFYDQPTSNTRTMRGSLRHRKAERARLLDSESESEIDGSSRPSLNGRIRHVGSESSDTDIPTSQHDTDVAIGQNGKKDIAIGRNGGNNSVTNALIPKMRLNSSEDESGL